MARGAQLTRQWRIIQKLANASRGVTIDDLAGDMDCSRRTIQRDLNALQEAGFPLYNPDHEGHKLRWGVLSTGQGGLPFPLELTELMALYLGRDVLKILKDTFIYENVDSFFKKIQAMLPAEAMEFLKAVENNLYVRQRPYKQYKKSLNSIFTAINQAIEECRVMDITYFTMSRGETTRRRIHPYGLWYFDGSFYVIGYCSFRDDIRVFAVDRVQSFKITATPFKRPDGFSAQDYMQPSFGVFRGKPIQVKVRFSAQVAGYIQERKWHESQTLTDRPDGSVVLEMRVAGIREVKFWIMGWGGQAEVLAPDSLRKEIKDEIQAMRDLYGC